MKTCALDSFGFLADEPLATGSQPKLGLSLEIKGIFSHHQSTVHCPLKGPPRVVPTVKAADKMQPIMCQRVTRGVTNPS